MIEPGCPDIVFPGRRKVIFVHGCFWHRHERCRLARLPKSRLDFWLPKLEANRSRDKKVVEELLADGWGVQIVWECQLADRDQLSRRLRSFLECDDASQKGGQLEVDTDARRR